MSAFEELRARSRTVWGRDCYAPSPHRVSPAELAAAWLANNTSREDGDKWTRAGVVGGAEALLRCIDSHVVRSATGRWVSIQGTRAVCDCGRWMGDEVGDRRLLEGWAANHACRERESA